MIYFIYAVDTTSYIQGVSPPTHLCDLGQEDHCLSDVCTIRTAKKGRLRAYVCYAGTSHEDIPAQSDAAFCAPYVRLTEMLAAA